MSLSTQLARGHLALSLLMAFALLALTAGRTADAQPALPQAVGIEVNAPTCSLPPRHVLVLAQAPADLGQLANRPQPNRVGPTCRA